MNGFGKMRKAAKLTQREPLLLNPNPARHRRAGRFLYIGMKKSPPRPKAERGGDGG